MILGDRIRAAGQDRPVFVYGATPLARYPAGRDLLRTLAQQARESGTAPYGLWLLCPSEAPRTTPNLDAFGAAFTGFEDAASYHAEQGCPPDGRPVDGSIVNGPVGIPTVPSLPPGEAIAAKALSGPGQWHSST